MEENRNEDGAQNEDGYEVEEIPTYKYPFHMVKRSSPKYSFGGRGIKRDLMTSDKAIPGPGAHDIDIDPNKRVLSGHKSIATIRMGKGSRDKYTKLYFGKNMTGISESGPGYVYDVAPRPGRDSASFSFGPKSRTSKDDRNSTNSTKFTKVDSSHLGPGSYNMQDAYNATLPTKNFKFGSESRDKYNKMYLLAGHQNLPTDGPGFAYSNTEFDNLKRIGEKNPEFSIGPRPGSKSTDKRKPKEKSYKMNKSLADYMEKSKSPQKMGVSNDSLTKPRTQTYLFGNEPKFQDAQYMPPVGSNTHKLTQGPIYDPDDLHSIPGFKFVVDSDTYIDKIIKSEIRKDFPAPGHTHHVFDKPEISKKAILTTEEHVEEAGARSQLKNIPKLNIHKSTRDDFSKMYYPNGLSFGECCTDGPKMYSKYRTSTPSYTFGGNGVSRSLAKNDDGVGPIYDVRGIMNDDGKRMNFKPTYRFPQGNRSPVFLYAPHKLNPKPPGYDSPGSMYLLDPACGLQHHSYKNTLPTFCFPRGDKNISLRHDPTVGSKVETPGPGTYQVIDQVYYK